MAERLVYDIRLRPSGGGADIVVFEELSSDYYDASSFGIPLGGYNLEVGQRDANDASLATVWSDPTPITITAPYSPPPPAPAPPMALPEDLLYDARLRTSGGTIYPLYTQRLSPVDGATGTIPPGTYSLEVAEWDASDPGTPPIWSDPVSVTITARAPAALLTGGTPRTRLRATSVATGAVVPLYEGATGVEYPTDLTRLAEGSWDLAVQRYLPDAAGSEGPWSDPVRITVAGSASVEAARYRAVYRTVGSGSAGTEFASSQPGTAFGLFSGALAPGAYEVQVIPDGGPASDWLPLQVLAAPALPPAPPAILPPPPAPVALAGLEVWSALQCAGGQRIIDVPRADVLVATDVRTPGGSSDALTVQLRHDSEAWHTLDVLRVLRVVYAGGSWDEWIITGMDDARSETGGATGTIHGGPVLQSLTDTDLVTRREADGSVSLDFDLFGLTPAEHLGVVRSVLPSWVIIGTVEPTDRINVAYPAVSGLAAVLAVAEAAQAELEFVRSGTGGYALHLRTQSGADAPPARLEYEHNVRGIRRTSTAVPLATRVYPTGQAVDEFLSDIGEAAWEVTGINAGYVTLAGSPLAFEGQFDGMYLEADGTGARALIAATDPFGQRVQLASTTGFAVGGLVLFRADATGTELLHLDRPSNYPLTPKRVERTDIPAVDNLAPNAFQDRWSGALPSGWVADAGASVSQEQAGPYTEYGSSSAHVVMAAPGDVYESGPFTVRPSGESPYFSVQVNLYVVTGSVRLELVTTDAVGIETVFPDAGQAYTRGVQSWVDTLAITGVDLAAVGAKTARVRLTNQNIGRTDFLLDAVMVTQTAGGASPFYDGRSGCDLWRAGNEYLQAHGTPELTYEIDVVDLARQNPTAFAAATIVQGGLVYASDAELGIDVTARVTRLERDLLRDAVSAVQVATEVPTLSAMLAQGASRAVRKRSHRPAPVSEPKILDVSVSYVGPIATVNARGNELARELWREEQIGGVWTGRFRFATAAQGSFATTADPTEDREFRVAAADETGTIGPWREVTVSAYDVVLLDDPEIIGVAQLSTGLGSVALAGSVREPGRQTGRLYAWVRRGSLDSADPNAAADGWAELTAPWTFGPSTVFTLAAGGTAQLIDAIQYNPQYPKSVYLAFEAADGRYSGQTAVELQNRMDAVLDRLGEVRAGSIRRAAQITRSSRPPGTGPALPPDGSIYTMWNLIPAEGEPYDERLHGLWRWDGAGWTRRMAAGDMADQITETQIGPGAVTSPAIRANAIGAREADIDQLRVGILNASVGIFEAISGGFAEFVTLRAEAASIGVLEANVLIALQAAIQTLSEIVPDAGIILDGVLGDPSGTAGIRLSANKTLPPTWQRYLDLGGAGGLVLRGRVEADEGYFSGELRAATGTFTGSPNLALDPGFEEGGSTWLKEAPWVVSTAQPRSGTYQGAYAGTVAAAIRCSRLSCTPGEPFYVEGWLNGAGGANGTARVRITWYDAADSEIGTAFSPPAPATGSYVKMVAVGTAPTGAVRMRGEFVVSGRTTGTWYADDMYLRRMVGGELVVDGTLTAIKLAIAALSEITDDAGIMVAGKLQNAAGTRYLWLDGATADAFLLHEKFALMNDGTALYTGPIRLRGGSSGVEVLNAAGGLLGLIVATSNGVTLRSASGGSAVTVAGNALTLHGSQVTSTGNFAQANIVIGPGAGAIAINFGGHNHIMLRAVGGHTLDVYGGRLGGIYNLVVRQENLGGHVTGWTASVKWPNGVVPVPSMTVNTDTWYQFKCEGDYYIAVMMGTGHAAATTGPAAAPSGLTATDSSYCLGSQANYAVQLAWTNGDAAASTEILRGGSVIYTVGPGGTGYTDSLPGPGNYSYSVRHKRNGIISAASSATGSVALLSCGGTGLQ